MSAKRNRTPQGRALKAYLTGRIDLTDYQRVLEGRASVEGWYFRRYSIYDRFGRYRPRVISTEFIGGR